MSSADNLVQRYVLGGGTYRPLLYAAVLLLVVIAGLLVLDWLLRADTLPIKQASFEGVFEHVTREQLEAAVMPALHSNFLVLDLEAIKRRAEDLPWVHRASVRRRWPAGVHIQFSEQRLVAHWQQDLWLNQYGELVQFESPEVSASLPQLSGPRGTQTRVWQQYQQFAKPLAGLGLIIEALHYSARHTWRLRLHSGVTLVLGRDDASLRLARFAKVYPQVLAQTSGVKQIDLRYTNGFAVQWKGQAQLAPSAQPKHGDGGVKG